MNKAKYIEDLKEIKEIMSRSARFISLSGLSGVSIGIIALAGAFIAYQSIFKDNQYLVYNLVELSRDQFWTLIIISIGILMLSIGNAVFFTIRKTKKQNQSVWDAQTQKLLINLLIPLITGGLLCLILLLKGMIGILPSLTLIFYGLALINGSKYTLPEIRKLGFIEIFLGLIALEFIDLGLIFWAIGFGVAQIIYGLIIQRKY
jgi:hypothetical protein